MGLVSHKNYEIELDYLNKLHFFKGANLTVFCGFSDPNLDCKQSKYLPWSALLSCPSFSDCFKYLVSTNDASFLNFSMKSFNSLLLSNSQMSNWGYRVYYLSRKLLISYLLPLGSLRYSENLLEMTVQNSKNSNKETICAN